MKDTINPIIAVLAAALGVASSYLMQLIVPLIVLVIAMLADYGTGMVKAWNAGTLCSRTGIRGILKKVGYLVIVRLSPSSGRSFRTTSKPNASASAAASSYCVTTATRQNDRDGTASSARHSSVLPPTSASSLFRPKRLPQPAAITTHPIRSSSNAATSLSVSVYQLQYAPSIVKWPLSTK